VTEDPRLYHLVIDSSGVDWYIKVEEAVAGEPVKPVNWYPGDSPW